MNIITSFRDQYRWLSNFHLCIIEYQGITYPSSEHAYQASKCLIKSDKLICAKLDSPGKAKRYGAKTKLRNDWEQIKLKTMEEILRIKFSIPILKSLLLDTGDMELIEGNTWGDTFWGMCNGIGKNNLGKILMKIRSDLRMNDVCPKCFTYSCPGCR